MYYIDPFAPYDKLFKLFGFFFLIIVAAGYREAEEDECKNWKVTQT